MHLSDAEVIAALSRQPSTRDGGVLGALSARDVAEVVIALEDLGSYRKAAVVRTLFLSAGVGATRASEATGG
ncbi:MAG: hypothetical protein JWL95_3327 [Gemmatimonadetes bacterium]|nr:hypothetical protein [Gemmatimonadota bacterium]